MAAKQAVEHDHDERGNARDDEDPRRVLGHLGRPAGCQWAGRRTGRSSLSGRRGRGCHRRRLRFDHRLESRRGGPVRFRFGLRLGLLVRFGVRFRLRFPGRSGSGSPAALGFRRRLRARQPPRALPPRVRVRPASSPQTRRGRRTPPPACLRVVRSFGRVSPGRGRDHRASCGRQCTEGAAPSFEHDRIRHRERRARTSPRGRPRPSRARTRP